MFTKMPEYRLTKQCHFLYIVLVPVGIVCLILLELAGNLLKAYADGIPGGNVTDPTVRAVDIAEPAVVRIITYVER